MAHHEGGDWPHDRNRQHRRQSNDWDNDYRSSQRGGRDRQSAEQYYPRDTERLGDYDDYFSREYPESSPYGDSRRGEFEEDYPFDDGARGAYGGSSRGRPGGQGNGPRRGRRPDWASQSGRNQRGGQFQSGGEYSGGQSYGSGEDGFGQFDPDYYRWRSEQLQNLDNDYNTWKQERYKKFSDEFDQWRSQRGSQRSGTAEGDTAAGKSRESKDK